jgi:hypothetical protein
MFGAAKIMPVPGSAATGTPWCATFITRLQISTGSPPPVALRVGEESSLPSQTPVMSGGVADKPGVAEILAGAGLAGGRPTERPAPLAVPIRNVSRIMAFIIATWRGSMTRP